MANGGNEVMDSNVNTGDRNSNNNSNSSNNGNTSKGKSGKTRHKKDKVQTILSRGPLIYKNKNPDNLSSNDINNSNHNHNHNNKEVVRKKDVEYALSELRYLILTEGLNCDVDSGICAYRGYVWSVLLQVNPFNKVGEKYLNLIEYGPASCYNKIKDDTFRTLSTDLIFQEKVTEGALIRVLNAFVNYQKMESNEFIDKFELDYVQGMNVLCAPFLFVCNNEAQAFWLFEKVILKECPLYVNKTVSGVHGGLRLLEVCLKLVDPILWECLHIKHKLRAEVYGFGSVMTLCACTPPLKEVLILWDFLFAYGAYLNVLCVVGQLLLMRDKLLNSDSPIGYLRTFPPLQARKVISLCVSFIPKLSDELFDLLQRHAIDETAAEAARSLCV